MKEKNGDWLIDLKEDKMIGRLNKYLKNQPIVRRASMKIGGGGGIKN